MTIDLKINELFNICVALGMAERVCENNINDFPNNECVTSHYKKLSSEFSNLKANLLKEYEFIISDMMKNL